MVLYLIWYYEDIDYNETRNGVLFIYKSKKKAQEHLDKLIKSVKDNDEIRYELEETETED